MRHPDAYDPGWPTATVRRVDGTTMHRRERPDVLARLVEEEVAKGGVYLGGTGEAERSEE